MALEPAGNRIVPDRSSVALDAPRTSPLIDAYLTRRTDLIRYFTARLRSESAAQDLVQDIFIRASAVGELEVENPAAYLYRLGTNLMLDRLKVRRRASARDGHWHSAHASAAASGETLYEGSGADDVADARLRLQRIIEVVRELPPQVQEAFRLHKLEGLTHAETAEAMNLSRSSVEKYIMTCLKRILAKAAR